MVEKSSLLAQDANAVVVEYVDGDRFETTVGAVASVWATDKPGFIAVDYVDDNEVERCVFIKAPIIAEVVLIDEVA